MVVFLAIMNVNDRDFEATTEQLLNEEISDSEDGLEEDEFDSASEQGENEDIPDGVNENGDSSDEEQNEFIRIRDLRDVLEQPVIHQDSSVDVPEEDDPGEENSEEDEGEGDEDPAVFYYGKPVGKNKIRIKWSSKEPTRRGRPNAHNIIRIPHLRGNARAMGNVASPTDIFDNLFTPEIVNEIIIHTNAKLSKLRPKYKDQTRPEIRDTHFMELRALLGLLFFGAVFKANKEDLKSLYATDGSGREIFRFVMSQKRIEILLYCLRFDDPTTRAARKENDPAAAISKLFYELIGNFQKSFALGSYTCVDEMLAKFRGRCKFKVYMPRKPARFGIKILILTDARSSYCYNAYIYTGKNSDGYQLSNEYNNCSAPTKSVVRLTQCIFNTNRNVTGDNWFSSIPLADLLTKKGLTYLGTLKKNKTEIPAAFQANRDRELGSSLYGFNSQMTLLSHVPKPQKAVILLSTMHHDKSVNEATNKPTMIADYNLTKGGVDNLDKMIASFSTARKTLRWPMRILYAMLDITGVNSFILYNAFRDNSPYKIRGMFLKDLAMGLVRPHMQDRLANIALQEELKMGICRVLKIDMPRDPPPAPGNPGEKSKRKRCYTCPPKKDRKTNVYCEKCIKPICSECSKKLCRNCIN